MKKNKILLSCSFDWLATQVCNDIIKGKNKPIYFTSLEKKYLRIRGLNKEVEIWNYFGLISILRVLIVKVTDNPYYFYPLFDLINLFNLIIFRPNTFVGWSSMSYLSLSFCHIFNIKTYLMCGSSHINDFYQLKTNSSNFINFIYSKWVKKEYELADNIIIESNFVKNSFLNNDVDAQKLIIVPTKPENKIFYNRSDYTINTNKFKCLTIGTQKIKSIDLIVEIWFMSKLHLKNDAELLIVGNLSTKITQMIENYNIKNIVNFKNLSLLKIVQIIEDSQVYICMSKNDAGPRSLVESYMLGCQIICSNNCIGPDIDSKNIHAFDLSEIKKASDKLYELYSKKNKKKIIPNYDTIGYEKII